MNEYCIVAQQDQVFHVRVAPKTEPTPISSQITATRPVAVSGKREESKVPKAAKFETEANVYSVVIRDTNWLRRCVVRSSTVGDFPGADGGGKKGKIGLADWSGFTRLVTEDDETEEELEEADEGTRLIKSASAHVIGCKRSGSGSGGGGCVRGGKFKAGGKTRYRLHMGGASEQ